ncbi:MAG TPA: hypothetical protein VIG89_00770 [Candidatus Acidoferrales bacterium]
MRIASRRPQASDPRLWAIVALIGYWSPWLTHPAASLRLNGYELSEWVTFLPGVRDGSESFGRLSFLVPLAGLALLLSIAAARYSRPHTRRRWIPPLPASLFEWCLLMLALLCNVAVFPPYPYLLTAYKEAEFQAQFFIAGALPFGILLTLYLPAELNDLVQICLAGLGGAYGLWALLAVQPVASELLNAPWAIGIGWLAMLAGFAGLVLAGLAHVFGPRAS